MKADESAFMVYMGARCYLPSVGRFNAPNPIVVLDGDGRNRNRYAYAYNNPVRYDDPTGLMTASVNCDANGDCTLTL